MTKIITSILFVVFFLANVASVSASQYGQGTYGQGTILGGVSDEVITHEPVEAGLEENLGIAGAMLVASAYILRKRAIN